MSQTYQDDASVSSWGLVALISVALVGALADPIFAAIAASYSGIVLVMGARMALRLCDVQSDTIANRALSELMHHYTVAEGKNRLVLTKKTGDMKLFLNDLDDIINCISSITSRW